MVYIDTIGSYIPENYLNNIYEAEKNNKDLNWLENSIGVLKTPKKNQNESVLTMCINAYKNLKSKTKVLEKEIDLIVLISQNTDNSSLPQQSTQLQSELNISNKAASFDISLGCSGYVYGLNIVESMMISNAYRSALLFTCDPYSDIINEFDFSNKLLFGDASTVTYITSKPKRDLLLTPKSFKHYSHGQYSEYLMKKNQGLHMDGRKIFSFVKKEVFRELDEFIAETNQPIDLIIPHQASQLTLNQFVTHFNKRVEIAIDIKNTGNTVSSSIPLILKNYLNNMMYDNLVLAGFGVGMSSSYSYLERKK